MICGAYTPGENRIDVRRLVEEGGSSSIGDRAEKIRPESCEFLLETGDRCRMMPPPSLWVARRAWMSSWITAGMPSA